MCVFLQEPHQGVRVVLGVFLEPLRLAQLTRGRPCFSAVLEAMYKRYEPLKATVSAQTLHEMNQVAWRSGGEKCPP